MASVHLLLATTFVASVVAKTAHVKRHKYHTSTEASSPWSADENGRSTDTETSTGHEQRTTSDLMSKLDGMEALAKIKDSISICTMVQKTRGTCRELCTLEVLDILDAHGQYVASAVAALAPAVSNSDYSKALKIAKECDYVNQTDSTGCQRAHEILACLGVSAEDFGVSADTNNT